MATSQPAPQNSGGPLAVIRTQLERMSAQFAMCIPPENVPRFKRVFMTMLTENPDLCKCTPQSLLGCAMRAAQDGLDLDGREAACVPFRDGPEMKAQYVPMVLGIRKKVRQTGLVSDWNVQVVFDGDEFDYALGDQPYIHHKPSLRGGRRRPVIAAYSIATFKDGTKSREVMNVDEIEDIRGKSKSSRGPWSDPVFYPEMARKTVARLHAKQLPQSSDLVEMFHREDNEGGDLPPPQQPPPQRISSVSAALDEFGSGHMPLAGPKDEASPSALSGPEGSGPPTDDSAEFSDSVPSGNGPDSSEPPGPLPPEEEAYQRGKEQKRAGHSSKALPPEYRDTAHTREALAWQAGWAGQPMPSWEAKS
jgi:recombination protein RecT